MADEADSTADRLLKIAVKEGHLHYEVVGPTRDGHQFVAGVVETVLRIDGNFEAMPDYIVINGVRYLPEPSR